MPEFLKFMLFKTPLWKFLSLFGGIVVLGFLAYWLSRFGAYLASAFLGHKSPHLKPIFRKAIGPASLLVAIALLDVLAGILNFPTAIDKNLDHLAHIALTLLGVWVLWDVIEIGCERLDSHLQNKKDIHVSALITLIKRAGKIILVTLSLVLILDNIGINVTSMIVGFGVGGIAIALAGQKVMENLFGSVVLILDRPVEVGDSCKFDSFEGTVEEIGLRSTKIRCLDRTLLSIPNGAFAEMKLENLTRRDKIRLSSTLGLRYETTPDQLRFVLAELRTLLLSHPRIYKIPCRVRLVKFGAYSLDIEISAFVKTSDWEEFLLVREDIFLKMMDIVSSSGTAFAFPSQTTYIEQGTGLDVERSEKAAQTVAGWRDKNECPVPQFSEKQYRQIKNTSTFPPHGSSPAPWINLDTDE